MERLLMCCLEGGGGCFKAFSISGFLSLILLSLLCECVCVCVSEKKRESGEEVGSLFWFRSIFLWLYINLKGCVRVCVSMGEKKELLQICLLMYEKR